MILADKIIELRKKNGWSQEDLAEKLEVSRQSISKWEGAQSVPDMNKILKLSEVFSVSTDYLLKDEIELDIPGEAPKVDTDSSSRFSNCLRRIALYPFPYPIDCFSYPSGKRPYSPLRGKSCRYRRTLPLSSGRSRGSLIYQEFY